VVYVEGGRIKSHGPLSENIAADSTLADAVEEEKESEDAEINLVKSAVTTSSLVTSVTSHGKLVAKEEVVEGHIGFASCKCFLCTSGN
jgi:lactam utilization protein B